MSENDPERLLRAKLRETSPAFESRWTDLKRTLRNEKAPQSSWVQRPWLWWTMPTLGALALTSLLLLPPKSARQETLPSDQISTYAGLLELDAELQEAMPLIDSELTDALLSMPIEKNDHS